MAVGLPQEPRIVGRYALHGPIASGGMATVHYGQLLGLGSFARAVAIKRLHPQYAGNPRFVAMFLDEARFAARVRHPNVVATLDVLAEDDEVFLVMEYVEGETLSRLLREMVARDQRIPLPVACAIAVGMLQGLHAAHESRNERGELVELVHRDVSPQNVLVGADGVARVLDFGIAKANGRLEETAEGQLKGKFAYMSPEQYDGESSRRSDIYAAGIVLWEMVTSRRLFHEPDVAVVVKRILSGDVPSPDTLVPELPRSLVAIVMKALSRRPEDRFATAGEMALAIEEAGDVTVAASSRVAAWCADAAGPAIEQRARTWESIATATTVSGAPAVAESIETEATTHALAVAPERRAARTGAIALGLVALAAVVGAVALGAGRAVVETSGSATAPAVSASAVAAETATASPTETATPSPTATASASATATASATAPAPASTAVAKGSGAKGKAPTRAAGKAPKASCDVPFTTGADGVKHFRRECL